MEQFIQDSGINICAMEEEYKFGKIALIMKVIGVMIKQMEKVD